MRQKTSFASYLAAAKSILKYMPVSSVSDLADKILVNFVHLSPPPVSGDGDRIIRYWKLLLIIFKASDKHNYGKEAVVLLLQYYCTFSEREKHTYYGVAVITPREVNMAIFHVICIWNT